MENFLDANHLDYEEEGPYFIYGAFGTFLLEKMKKLEDFLPLIDRCFNFINYPSNQNNAKINNLLKSEIIGTLTLNNMVALKSYLFLNEVGKKWLEQQYEKSSFKLNFHQ